MKYFVAFWATFDSPQLSDSFFGNMEVKCDSPESMADIESLERHIKEELNFGVEEEVAKVSAVTVINWKAL
jgi:hypothetical protein